MTSTISLNSTKEQLLRVNDEANSIASLIDALDMATSGMNDSRQRNAMAAACDVLMDRMDNLKALIEAARAELK